MDQMQAEQVAQGQLEAGERLLWSGTPNPGGMALAGLPGVLVGLPFSGFAVFWMWMAFSMTRHSSHPPGPWALFPFFGLPFLLVGLGCVTAPLWAWLGARRTVYAVTDQRVMIMTGGPVRGVRSFAPGEIGNLVRVERADGRGSLSFIPAAGAGAWSGSGVVFRVGAPGPLARVSLVGIPRVREVERLIRDHLLSKAA